MNHSHIDNTSVENQGWQKVSSEREALQFWFEGREVFNRRKQAEGRANVKTAWGEST